ncbi:uncharacterized protein BO97DRAFT_425095 [Aspergillus homomorphus CBS 101889]|uniref:Uncharacterized protein n=1 Tax=Aspergillus homomorphus (strain CBS 101889) TaxID=1450537 RepID=A0A395HW97_ASPHC|nr:hypothetical protein BO97DRAFT_425095 [Aspergillus homomorphus CBS 101889]RAL11796.1 hypothetical protein BO97DRAFT_425095 [Aspergillus homomorphus CBS 101889]
MSANKRARANPAGDAHIRSTETEEPALAQGPGDPRPRREDPPGRAGPDRRAVDAEKRKRQAHVISFDRDSGQVWKALNVTHARLSGSRQYEKTFEVADDIRWTIKSIAGQCGPLVNAQTRYNGLSVLRKIGRSIVLSCGDTLPHDVQKSFQSDTTLERAMMAIVKGVEKGERERVMRENTGDGLWAKLMQLTEEASEYRCFTRLGDVLRMMEGEEIEVDLGFGGAVSGVNDAPGYGGLDGSDLLDDYYSSQDDDDYY